MSKKSPKKNKPLLTVAMFRHTKKISHSKLIDLLWGMGATQVHVADYTGAKKVKAEKL